MSAGGKSRNASVVLTALLLLAGVAKPAMAQQAEVGRAEESPRSAAPVSVAEALQARSLFDVEPVTSDSVTTDSSEAAVEHVDAWGANRSWAWAIGEVLMVNNLVWAFNEYIRGANFTQVNPRSWYNNVFVYGFSYDDNQFKTNMFAHPYHGNLYYNAARSNGFNYWMSLPFALGGSALWECCGETHQPAINDWIMTGIGGTAIGEMTYRLSSTVLDNTATGSERTWREIGALVMNPVRGFNRLVSGRWSQVGTNPADRMPSSLANALSVGVRAIGEGESIKDKTSLHAFFQIDFRYGSPFSMENRKPFDYFVFGLQVNSADKAALGRLQIRGNLYTKDLKVTDKVHHVFSIAQAYDYMNNNAYEFGGQSAVFSILSHWTLSQQWQLWSTVDLYGMLMGAVNSNFAFLAEFPPEFNQERLREYDFGTGGGPALGLGVVWKGRQMLLLRYRLTYLYTLNGSVQEGDNAHHYIHEGYVRGRVPISRNFGIGLDASVFLRDSYYTCDVCAPYVKQRNPELRIYGIWDVGPGAREPFQE